MPREKRRGRRGRVALSPALFGADSQAMTGGLRGRLELTWTNKHLRLLAHEDGSYEWVPPSDYRVAEVRLLHDVATMGEVRADRAKDNLLIRGDALHGLTSLVELPEFAREYVGKVKLCYIDPPFNTGQAFSDYDDALEHSVWLTMIRDRLQQVKHLLADDGSVWLHLDEAESHYGKVLMDEVFGRDRFVDEVVWRSADSSNHDAKQFSLDHNVLLVYGKSPEWRTYPLPRGEEDNAHYSNPDDDPRGPWFPGNVSSPNPRANLRYLVDESFGWQGTPIEPPSNGWRWQRSLMMEKIQSGEVVLLEEDPGSSRLVRKTYLADQGGLAPSTLWADLADTGHNRQAKYELKKLFPGTATADLFKTPKPERLIRRILEVATLPGDVVLDFFLGSGTTAAVAHKTGRRWVGVEWSADTVARFALPRLRSVVEGQDEGGITESVTTEHTGDLPDGVEEGGAKAAAKVLSEFVMGDRFADVDNLERKSVKEIARILRAADSTKTTRTMLWDGGGGFRVLDVAPSMFEEDQGLVVLSDWAVNGALGEATAAQLGYGFEPAPPFSGRKGRTRLAVVDGLANEPVVRLLASALGEDERVVVCGTAIDPAARSVLKELRPGSTMRKIPASILDDYSRPRSARLTEAVSWDSEALQGVEE